MRGEGRGEKRGGEGERRCEVRGEERGERRGERRGGEGERRSEVRGEGRTGRPALL